MTVRYVHVPDRSDIASAAVVVSGTFLPDAATRGIRIESVVTFIDESVTREVFDEFPGWDIDHGTGGLNPDAAYIRSATDRAVTWLVERMTPDGSSPDLTPPT